MLIKYKHRLLKRIFCESTHTQGRLLSLLSYFRYLSICLCNVIFYTSIYFFTLSLHNILNDSIYQCIVLFMHHPLLSSSFSLSHSFLFSLLFASTLPSFKYIVCWSFIWSRVHFRLQKQTKLFFCRRRYMFELFLWVRQFRNRSVPNNGFSIMKYIQLFPHDKRLFMELMILFAWLYVYYLFS